MGTIVTILAFALGVLAVAYYYRSKDLLECMVLLNKSNTLLKEMTEMNAWLVGKYCVDEEENDE
jgi:hypothetical protein